MGADYIPDKRTPAERRKAEKRAKRAVAKIQGRAKPIVIWVKAPERKP